MHDVVHLADDLAGLFHVVPVNLHVHRGLRAEAGDPLDDPAGIEDRQHAGKQLDYLGPGLVHDLDLIARPLVRRHQIDLDESRMRSRIGIEERRPPLLQNSDAGDDRLQFLGLDRFAEDPLDLRHLLLRLLHPLADRRAHDDPELTLVGDGDKLAPDQGHQRQRSDEDQDDRPDQSPAMGQRPGQQHLVADVHRLVLPAAPLQEPGQPIRQGPLGFAFRLHELVAERRSHRP